MVYQAIQRRPDRVGIRILALDAAIEVSDGQRCYCLQQATLRVFQILKGGPPGGFGAAGGRGEVFFGRYLRGPGFNASNNSLLARGHMGDEFQNRMRAADAKHGLSRLNFVEDRPDRRAVPGRAVPNASQQIADLFKLSHFSSN